MFFCGETAQNNTNECIEYDSACIKSRNGPTLLLRQSRQFLLKYQSNADVKHIVIKFFFQKPATDLLFV